MRSISFCRSVLRVSMLGGKRTLSIMKPSGSFRICVCSLCTTLLCRLRFALHGRYLLFLPMHSTSTSDSVGPSAAIRFGHAVSVKGTKLMVPLCLYSECGHSISTSKSSSSMFMRGSSVNTSPLGSLGCRKIVAGHDWERCVAISSTAGRNSRNVPLTRMDTIP